MLEFCLLELVLADAVPELDVLLDFLLQALLVVAKVGLLVEDLLADGLVLGLYLLEFALVEVPVAARDVLVGVGVECFYRGVLVPDAFEEVHVLLLEVALLLLLPEDLGGRFGLAEGGGERFYFLLIALE